MNSENFCYWLQGFFELTDNTKLSEQQVQMIKNHLALVFVKVTPKLDGFNILDTKFTGVTARPLCGNVPIEELLNLQAQKPNICSVSPLSDPNQRKYC